VVLKNQQARRVRLFGLFMCLIGFLLLLYRGVAAEGTRMSLLVAGAVGILAVWNFLEGRKGKKSAFRVALLLIAGGVLLLPPFGLLSAAGLGFLAMALIERKALAPTEIGFAEDHIRFNGLLNKDHAWSDLQSILLKDGILTMDFHNNHLLQLETDDEEDDEYDAEEDEFNDWCAMRLGK
jgi:hypothetical protein